MVPVYIFSLLVPFVLIAQQDAMPRETTLFRECEPETICRTDAVGLTEPFSLRWRNKKEGKNDFFLIMEIGGGIFEVPMSPDFIRAWPFPLRLYIFSDTLMLYGLASNVGSGGIYVNYFARDEDGSFHYLGLFPFLSYDKDSGYFVGGESHGSVGYTTYYYRLDVGALDLVKVEDFFDMP